ncbi:error-prone DNA polymerase [Jannaschia sp. LMIT008]|uniref:error-prone DNA polymerase n=1 Tax=Jannaschia maritima TaxID=3032585 RepID=UPI0028127690|nr:error-prone DNA polymerase [Jannaschia sp. LMIT008]
MPLNDSIPKRTLSADNPFHENDRAPFVEFGLASAFSFLRGASEPCDLIAAANLLGYDRIGIADRNTLAGVVRMWTEGRTAKVDALIGCRLVLTCGAELLAYPQDKRAYERLTELLSAGKMNTPDGKWQEKGVTQITLDMLGDAAEGLHLIVMPGEDLDAFESELARLSRRITPTHIGASFRYRGDDRARINRLDDIARRNGMSILATNDVAYHLPERRPLQDILTCIREKTTVMQAGYLLQANAERHLKAPTEIVRFFADWPHAVRSTRELADRIAFRMEDLRYEYLREMVPAGATPLSELKRLTWIGANARYSARVPKKVRRLMRKEFRMIEKKRLSGYFLTIHHIVKYATEELDPPVLCQGRGSAANSAVCYCLGITSVDPQEFDVLFERFLSEERNEPPDIDIDFEHERREEVIQHIYRKYGADRAGLCATVIHYRPRSALREVGKVMGLTEDVTSRLAGTVWGHFENGVGDDRVKEAGLDLADPLLRRVLILARQLIGLPRHLSQHVGGFVLTDGPLTRMVPIGNGAMPNRRFIEWDKDDVEAMGIYKLDVLALGMLTCLAKGFDLLRRHKGVDHDLASVPKEHLYPDGVPRPTYDMLCRGESLGVFQVESRAQMAMLPKLQPRVFYDLVIEVAIVRPGPIQGDMVHPYLARRRAMLANPGIVFDYPTPGPRYDQNELKNILGRTLGVPIFQEQAMKIAMVAAEFNSAEANKLRKAMATFRDRGEKVKDHKARMVERMVARGYDREFATKCFSQIEGFGEYGFPESHAASFAKLVYVSSWMKCHHPDVFACALLNSQPMGFYAPAQIVRDARENGVEIHPVDVTVSNWDCTLGGETSDTPPVHPPYTPRTYATSPPERPSRDAGPSRSGGASGDPQGGSRSGPRVNPSDRPVPAGPAIAPSHAPRAYEASLPGQPSRVAGPSRPGGASGGPRGGPPGTVLDDRIPLGTDGVPGGGVVHATGPEGHDRKRAAGTDRDVPPGGEPGRGSNVGNGGSPRPGPGRGPFAHDGDDASQTAGGMDRAGGGAGDGYHALRLGLRMIDGMRRDAATRIVAARAQRPFADVEDLRRRARLDAGTMKRLAAADALGGLSAGRRAGMWDVLGQHKPKPAPLFDAADARDTGPDAPVALPPMPPSEEVVSDYRTTRLSLRAHPMSFFRTSLTRQHFAPAAALPDRGHGAQVQVAGLVLVRQKPGSAKGVCFITLEDETGVINLVVWKDLFARYRGTIMRSRLMAVRGQVQTDGTVIHVVAREIVDRTDALDRLSEDTLRAITTRGDHPTNPIPGQVDALPRPDMPRTHPRDARVIPKSRDFH